MLRRFIASLHQPVDILPLVIFRIAFGVLMFFSTLRFILRGWVREFYIDPIYHFTYWGFSWIAPLPPSGMWIVFIALLILSLMIAIGLCYRISITSFFLLFTYVELIDKTYYLNHYYFVSVMSLLMIALPLHRKWSLDGLLFPSLKADVIPAWMLYMPRLMLGIVYFYAGLAKLNPDWLLGALPMRIWLPANADLPLVGSLFDKLWVAYAASWFGAIYDLTIPFWLIWRRSRPLAYGAVIGFHLLTAALFNIGVFPYVMIFCTLIFFSGADWRKLFSCSSINLNTVILEPTFKHKPLLLTALGAFFLWQLLMPLRHWLYPGNHMWTNEGYRFAWHVMLVEKNGSVTFRVEDEIGDFWIIYPKTYLTPQQAQQMSFQPDMLLQFAHFLADEYASECECQPEVYADTYVSFNLRRGQVIIQPDVNLASQSYSLQPAAWVAPLESR
jgi:hypothetical protein